MLAIPVLIYGFLMQWSFASAHGSDKLHASIFIALPTRDGFVDVTETQLGPERDLETELKYVPEFTRVGRESDADLVVTVLGRGFGPDAFGELVSTSPLVSQAIIAGQVRQNEYWVLAVLSAQPTYKRLLVGSSPGPATRNPTAAWRECARAIAKDLRLFVRANAARFKTRRPA